MLFPMIRWGRASPSGSTQHFSHPCSVCYPLYFKPSFCPTSIIRFLGLKVNSKLGKIESPQNCSEGFLERAMGQAHLNRFLIWPQVVAVVEEATGFGDTLTEAASVSTNSTPNEGTTFFCKKSISPQRKARHIIIWLLRQVLPFAS